MRKNPTCHLLSCFLLLIFSNFYAYSNGAIQETLQWTQPFKQCWSYNSDKILGTSTTNIASDNKQIIIPLSLGILESVDASSGIVLWRTELGGEIISKVTTDEKYIYILNNSEISDTNRQTDSNSQTNVVLRSINPITGITNWSKSLSFNAEPSFYISSQSILLITKKGYLLAINKEDGSKLWESNVSADLSNTSFSSNMTIIGTFDRKILLISSLNGSVVKEIITDNAPTNSVLLDSGKIFWADKKGYLNGYDLSSGKLMWKRRFGGEISSLASTSQGILVSSIDNFIYLLNENNGKIIWKRRLAARVTEKPFIKGDFIVASAFGESTSLFIELKSGRIINTLTLSDANYFVGNPIYINELLVFPTLKGLYAFGTDCSKIKKTGE